MQPRPLASVMDEPAMQNSAADKGPLILTCPSLNWPAVPITAPEAEIPKQQEPRWATKALEPATRASDRRRELIMNTTVRFVRDYVRTSF